MRAALAAATCLLLGACASTAPTPLTTASLEPAPANWRQLVAENIRATARNNRSIRDASVAAPVREILPPNLAGTMPPRWVVCARFNAQNAYGGFTGLRTYHVTIEGGRVTSSFPAAQMGPTCDGAAFEPFKELEA